MTESNLVAEIEKELTEEGLKYFLMAPIIKTTLSDDVMCIGNENGCIWSMVSGIDE